jgi:preprotein translocase subunit SecY
VKLADTLRAAWNEPELRQRILFIFAIFGVYVIALNITLPIQGVKPEAITAYLEQQTGGYLGLLNLFGGGAIGRISIISLGLNPYITSSIIMQLMSVAIPSLKQEKQEGGQFARQKEAQRTRLLTLVLCVFQSWGLIQLFRGGFPSLSFLDYGAIIIIWTAGAMLVLWLGEQIQEKGIGQGVSLMIFAGIVVSFPLLIERLSIEVSNDPGKLWRVGLLLAIFIAVTAVVVYFTQAQRRINIQHMRRSVGTKAVGGGSSFLPIPVNAAGVIPIIFAVSLVYIPSQFATMAPPGSLMADIFNKAAEFLNPQPTSAGYTWIIGSLVYAAMIFFFTYLWTSIQYNVEDIAVRLKQTGAYIPGVRQGKQTEVFLDGVISRITFVGAAFLTFVALIPYWVPLITRLDGFQIIGGTSLLIIVSVVLDLMRQIEANLIMRGYNK